MCVRESESHSDRADWKCVGIFASNISASCLEPDSATFGNTEQYLAPSVVLWISLELLAE